MAEPTKADCDTAGCALHYFYPNGIAGRHVMALARLSAEAHAQERAAHEKALAAAFDRGAEEGACKQVIFEIQGRERFMKGLKADQAEEREAVRALTREMRRHILPHELEQLARSVEALMGSKEAEDADTEPERG